MLWRYTAVFAIICILIATLAGCGGKPSGGGGLPEGGFKLPSSSPDSSDEAPEQAPDLSDEAFTESTPEEIPPLSVEDFEEYFAQNPIEPAFRAEMDSLLSTYDICQCLLKYSELWSAEINWAYERLTELSRGIEKERYESDYALWSDTGADELQAKIDYYNANEVTGGTIDSINRNTIEYDFYYEKAKAVCMELYRYDNNYAYLFSGQSPGDETVSSNVLPDGEYDMRLYTNTGFYEFEGETIITAALLECYSYDDAFVRGLNIGSLIETPNGMEAVTELTWHSDTRLQITYEWTLGNGLYGWVLCYPSQAAAFRVKSEMDIVVPDTAEIIDCTDWEPVTRANLFELLSLRQDCDVLVTMRGGNAVRVEKYYVP